VTRLPAKDPVRFAETRIGDEVVVMNLATGDFFSLTGSAAAIWNLLDGTQDRASAIAGLSARFAANPGGIAADLDDFLRELDRAGLLVHR